VQGIGQVTLHTHLPSLAPLMVQADLAIGAGGATSWERCCLGLPSLVVTLAENQKPITAELDRQGLIRWLGHKDDVSEHGLARSLAAIVDKGLTPAWSQQCQQLADGRGTERVRSLLLLSPETPLRARFARLDDEALILQWANDPLVRENAFTTGTIDPNTHHAWFHHRLHDLENCRLYVVETEEGLPVGQVRFERHQGAWEVHYSLDARCRSRRMGVPTLATALQAFRSLQPSGRLYGRVKPVNTASRKVFRSLGFSEESGPHELIYRQATG
jgi:UDP-2,4-diacetamido-2,4,6-trideoxy-beta-L-altropyranose hydrolase